MTCEINSHWIYRAMIDSKLKNQPSLIIKNNQKDNQNQKYANEARKNSNNEPNENKMLRKPHNGFYALKEKHTYYFSPTFFHNYPSAAEMVNKYSIIRDNEIGKANSILIYLKPISIGHESVRKVSKFKDWKLNHRYVLSHGDYSTNYSQNGVTMSENSQENSTNKSETSFLNRFLNDVRQNYIMPNLALENHAYGNYSIQRFLSGIRKNYKLPNLVPEDQTYSNAPENYSNASDNKAKGDLCEMNKKFSSNLESTLPGVTLQSPEANIKSEQKGTTFKDWKLSHRYVLSHGDYSEKYSRVTEKGTEMSGNCQENTNKSEINFLNRFLFSLRQNYIIPYLDSGDHAYENYSIHRFLSGIRSNYIFPNLVAEDFNVPKSKAEANPCEMNKESSSNFEITLPEETLQSAEANIESVQKETSNKDVKLNYRNILSHGDYFSNYSHITEKGVEMFGNCRENTNKSNASYIQQSGIRQNYIRPNIASGDHVNENCSIHRFLSSLSQKYKIPNIGSGDQEYENCSNAPESKAELDLCETNKESSSNLGITLPEVTLQSPEANIESWSCYAKDEIDDETYEFLSILEDDSNDIKEKPRYSLLKGRFREKFGFEARNTLEKPLDVLTQTPNGRRSRFFNPCLNRSEFCSHFQTRDRSLSDEGFFVDPIYRDDDINRKKDNPEMGVPDTREIRWLGFVSFVKSLFHTEDRKNIRRFVKP